MVYTSAGVVDCHRKKYVTIDDKVAYAEIESPGCCVKSKNFLLNSDEIQYDIGPVSGYSASCPLLVSEKGSLKILATTGSEESLCIIVAVCQPDYHGINISCRARSPPLYRIRNLLFNVLGPSGLPDIYGLRRVSQRNCRIRSDNCPYELSIKLI